MLPRNTPQGVRSIHCKLKMITETDKAARSVNEISGSIKSYIISRSRKVSFYSLQWPNWAWNIVFGYTHHILIRTGVTVWFVFTQRIQFISLMPMECRVQVLVRVVFLYLIAAAVSQKLRKYHTELSIHKHSLIYIVEPHNV